MTPDLLAEAVAAAVRAAVADGDLALAPADPGSALPFVLTPMLVDGDGVEIDVA